MIKPVTLFHLAALVTILVFYRERSQPRALGEATIATAGFFVMPVLFALIYLVSGNIEKLYECFALI